MMVPCLGGAFCSLWLDLLGRWGLPTGPALLPDLGLPRPLRCAASGWGSRGPEQKPGCPAGLEHEAFLVHLQSHGSLKH